LLTTAEAYGLTFIVPEQDTGVGASLRHFGEYARPEIDLICDLLAPFGTDAAFVDVGANLGAICLPVAKRNRCKVLAFEPSRRIHSILAAQCAQ
jgi:hypothetical protein